VNLYKGYALIPVDVLAETVRTALAGGVIGAVLGMRQTSNRPILSRRYTEGRECEA